MHKTTCRSSRFPSDCSFITATRIPNGLSWFFGLPYRIALKITYSSPVGVF